MAQFTVTTANDVVDPNDGRLSLREAVAQANATAAADTIVFAPKLEGTTLTLTQGQLVLSQDITIDGNSNNDAKSITLSGNYNDRIFQVSGESEATLTDLSLTKGQATYGGSTYASGGALFVSSGSHLNLEHSLVSHSRCGYLGYSGDGGGIYVSENASLTVNNSTIRSNVAHFGAGIGAESNAIVEIHNSNISDNYAASGGSGGGIFILRGSLNVDGSIISNNFGDSNYNSYGGGISAQRSNTVIVNSLLSGNFAKGGGAINASGNLQIVNSTIAGNYADNSESGGYGAAVSSSGTLSILHSTITGNVAGSPDSYGGPGGIYSSGDTYIGSSIIVANFGYYNGKFESSVWSESIQSDGHNIFGNEVDGIVPGDRIGVDAHTLFAALDGAGGGMLGSNNLVALLNSALNPALSGGDPLTAGAFDQIGTTRPLPAGSLPDIGAAELNQRTFSTSPSSGSDVLTGTAAANTISGLSLNDRISGLGGDDTLNGNDGSDRLDGGDGKDTLNGGQGSDLLIGGSGNDRLIGDTGVDLAFFGGSTKVAIDLGLGRAVRGGETDTLSGIEGAIGSSAADTFKGDANANWFQGGLGRDVFTGGGGRDFYDFNAVADSKSGSATRDVITDFTPLTDKLDLSGIDADPTVAGNQAFRWIGSGTLDGPGELGFVIVGGNTIVQASTDADAAAEFQIQLTGIKALSAVDFFL